MALHPAATQIRSRCAFQISPGRLLAAGFPPRATGRPFLPRRDVVRPRLPGQQPRNGGKEANRADSHRFALRYQPPRGEGKAGESATEHRHGGSPLSPAGAAPSPGRSPSMGHLGARLSFPFPPGDRLIAPALKSLTPPPSLELRVSSSGRDASFKSVMTYDAFPFLFPVNAKGERGRVAFSPPEPGKENLAPSTKSVPPGTSNAPGQARTGSALGTRILFRVGVRAVSERDP